MQPAEEVLATLQSHAAQREHPELAWQAAVGAIEILMWRDDFSQAAELSERTLVDIGPLETDLNLQIMPFDLAIICADAHANEPSAPRLQRAATRVPRNSPLGERLELLAEEAPHVDARESIRRNRPWEKAQRSPKRTDREALAMARPDLGSRDLRRVWGAVRRTNDFELALDLTRDLGPPADWPAAMWFAQWAVHHGDAALAGQALLVARPHYFPYAPWVLLPTSPPVDPDVRPALTEEVRQEFLAAVTMPDLRHA